MPGGVAANAASACLGLTFEMAQHSTLQDAPNLSGEAKHT